MTSITLKDGVWKKEFKGWVDPCSNEDPYSKEMWAQFSAYLQNLVAVIKDNAEKGNAANPPFTFHRGRYGTFVFKKSLQKRTCHPIDSAEIGY